MATQVQYNAATAAIKALADHMIATEVPILEQGLARQALSDERLTAFARAAVDAAFRERP